MKKEDIELRINVKGELAKAAFEWAYSEIDKISQYASVDDIVGYCAILMSSFLAGHWYATHGEDIWVSIAKQNNKLH